MASEDILLEPDQEELLCRLVEADRNVSKEERQKFFGNAVVFKTDYQIHHKGLRDSYGEVFPGDLEILAENSLLALSYDSPDRRSLSFHITPLGYQHYREINQRTADAFQRIQERMTSYLKGDRFQSEYPQAYRKWSIAETMLWEPDVLDELTDIGHRCREALQEFADTLVSKYPPRDVDQDKTHTEKRLKAVVISKADQLGEKERKFLYALPPYWRAVSDLVQRQEHGGQKEGEALTWEDGHRVVFQTAMVMFEIDRTLSRVR